MRFPHPGGFGGFGGFGGIGQVFTDVMAGLVFLICLAVVVGLLFVLVRFLLVATKAAEIYVAKNSSATTTQAAAATVPPTAE